MSIRTLVLAGLAVGLLATVAPVSAADETAPAGESKSAEAQPGEKEYKQRVNLVARKPLRHDIGWMEGRDRASWREFTTWQGIRDERPMVARKTLGFHEPRPHLRRAERVERLARGPLVGPAPAE